MGERNGCIIVLGWNLFKYLINNFVDGHKCIDEWKIWWKNGWMMIERCKNDGHTRDEWWMYTIYAHSLVKKMLWEVMISNIM